MTSVPETAEIFQHEMAPLYASHPAAEEAAASLRSVTGGLRVQFTDRRPVATGPDRVPSHNARVAGFLASRQSQLAAQGQCGSVAPAPHGVPFPAGGAARVLRRGSAPPATRCKARPAAVCLRHYFV